MCAGLGRAASQWGQQAARGARSVELARRDLSRDARQRRSGGARIPIDRIVGDGNNVRLEARAVKGSFEGTMNAEKTKISGTWSQDQPLPLVFERTSEGGKRESAADMPKRASYPCGVPLVLDVPFAPVPLAGGGKTHLCYELRIMNTSCHYTRRLQP